MYGSEPAGGCAALGQADKGAQLGFTPALWELQAVARGSLESAVQTWSCVGCVCEINHLHLILKDPSWMILKIELCKAIISKEQPSSHVNQWNFELEAGVCAGLHMIPGLDGSKFIEVSCLLAYSINRFFFLRGKNPEGEQICNIHLHLTAAPCWKEKITIFGLELGFFLGLSGFFLRRDWWLCCFFPQCLF